VKLHTPSFLHSSAPFSFLVTTATRRSSLRHPPLPPPLTKRQSIGPFFFLTRCFSQAFLSFSYRAAGWCEIGHFPFCPSSFQLVRMGCFYFSTRSRGPPLPVSSVALKVMFLLWSTLVDEVHSTGNEPAVFVFRHCYRPFPVFVQSFRGSPLNRTPN